jgi:flagellar hook-length control protein FliK
VQDQVLRGLNDTLASGQTQEKLTIRLNPEKLGQVDVQFLARGNQLEVVVTASGREAEQALREGVKELTEAIADKSTRFQQVEIRIENRGQEQDKNDNRQDQKKDQSRGGDGQTPGRQQDNQQRGESSAAEWAAARQE